MARPRHQKWVKTVIIQVLTIVVGIGVGESAVSFDRDVRPVLTAKCYQCHGPDGESREADLRLDEEASARKVLDELVERVYSTDQDEVMPPPESGKSLSKEEKSILKEWIASGAKWEKHWSSRELIRPDVPEIDSKYAGWNRNPIDRFVRKAQEERGLEPSPVTDPLTYIRRITFDLTGLPPTPAEIREFVDAFSSNPDVAIESLVERLLASPHYGERWGRHWLDVVKYADTCGYDKDKLRPNSWPYRDYVIRSFNEDKPYARFVREQIAGDALYPGTADGILGLGFIAAGPWDFIGHVEVPESKIDGRVARHIDRDEMVSNTLNTFTSVTVQCARCHDHKFDPITQDHYYSLQSVFAAVDRAERVYQSDPDVENRKLELSRSIESHKKKLSAIEAQMASEGGEKLVSLEKRIAEVKPQVKLAGKKPEFGYHSGISKNQEDAKWVTLDFGKPVGINSIILRPTHDDYNGIGAGFGFPVRFQVRGYAGGQKEKPAVYLDQSAKDFPNPGLRPVEVEVGGGVQIVEVHVNKLAPRSQDFIFALAELVVLDESGKNIAATAKVEAKDSVEAPVRWQKKNLVDGIFPEAGNPALAGELEALEKDKAQMLASIKTPEREAELKSLNDHIQRSQNELNKLPKGKLVYAAASHFSPQGNFKPTMGKPRTIKVLHRGDILSPKHEVEPGVIPIFEGESDRFSLPEGHGESLRRAALAEWITRPDHPLTWRSIANRVWLWHFGRGIVDTPNDFGRMGQPPTHPELLDWLACEFRDNGGSFKHLHRLIVTSATYRQQSGARPEAAALDSDNRYLWRMNRRRLEAEELRDSVLAVSGALDRKAGGPGFYLFALEKTAHSPHYEYHKFDPSDQRSHRRSVYRFIVRSQPDPFMTTLDCADSSQSTPKRGETLTALQALSLLNNKFTLFMAERFALRLESMHEDLEAQIAAGFELATGRLPDPDEMEKLSAYAGEHGLPNFCRILFNLSEFTYMD